MSRMIITCGLVLAAILLAVLSPRQHATINVASAATASAPFTIEWYSIDGGGTTQSAAAGRYTLNGTVGQYDATVQTGSQYTLSGGFWSGIDPRFLGALPLVQR